MSLKPLINAKHIFKRNLEGSLKRNLNQTLKQGFKNNTDLPLLPNEQLLNMGFVYSIYRFIISLFLFISSYALVLQNDQVIINLPSFLHQTTLLFYGVFSFFLLALLYLNPNHLRKQLGIGLIFDVVVISILLYLTGTPDIQLVMLYVVVVAASFIMLAPYQALTITFLAIIFIIYQQFFNAITNSMSIADLGDAILLCFSFLGVGFFSWYVSQRLAEVERLAADRANEVAKLNTINQQVISTIAHGVMVMSEDLTLKLTNRATIYLLDLKLPPNVIQHISYDKYTSQVFTNQFNEQHPKLFAWLSTISRDTQAVYNYDITHSDVMINKLRLNTTPLEDGSLLILIEDIRREQSRAQQLKLASLGQLTASIAHEIRNPLAAISQASQLLIEDAETTQSIQTTIAKTSTAVDINGDAILPIDETNKELYRMIFKQTKRVNRIIEDVLSLSRQSKPDLLTFDLVSWLHQFIEEHYTSEITLSAKCHPRIHFDTHQLEQILVNLVNNAIQSCNEVTPSGHVEIEVGCQKNDVILDVLDTGSGVKPAHQADLFNPFFTTRSEGTGLGLYLSQAFTEANHSRLMFVPNHKKTCFRLVIPKATEVA